MLLPHHQQAKHALSIDGRKLTGLHVKCKFDNLSAHSLSVLDGEVVNRKTQVITRIGSDNLQSPHLAIFLRNQVDIQ